MDYKMVLKNILIVFNSLFYFSLLLFFASCNDYSNEAYKLNSQAYDNHYRNICLSEELANKAYNISGKYSDERAEALNNLAFASITKMNYDSAYIQLEKVAELTSNQVELLIADVQYMRLCQRMSRNREFYEYRERAKERIRRISEEKEKLSDHDILRFIYAETEFAIVNSTYYYYVGLDSKSIEAINTIERNGNILRDTAQYLNYLYNIGSGGIIKSESKEEVIQQEFEILIKCYTIANTHGYTFFKANSLEAISLLFATQDDRETLIADNPLAIRALDIDNIADDSIAISLANKALNLFKEFGDIYQIAGAYRSLATCYMAIGDYDNALLYLEQALANDKISLAPDLVASIREQLSVAYSAVNNKQQSDYNRNIYLELQEHTRQDRSLEARADMLDKLLSQLNLMIAIVLLAIVILLILLYIFYKWNDNNKNRHSLDKLLTPLKQWEINNGIEIAELRTKIDSLNEKLEITKARILNNEIKNLEHRTKLSLINSTTPFIDRLINEANQLVLRNETEDIKQERCEYIKELIDKINDYNDILTKWIELRCGELKLHIESFPLQDLFNVLTKGHTAFELKGIDFKVKDTKAVVKADRMLTIFMINTLADNARKFTPAGGSVTIEATETNDYVEISISDTGIGIDADELSSIFSRKISNGHGFGLMNCKGIIEKYRKTSKLFNVCKISAESEKGKGSRFSFRLPHGIIRMISAIIMLSAFNGYIEANNINNSDEHEIRNLSLANSYVDSIYVSNINGQFDKALQYADSCIKYINNHYHLQHPNGVDTLEATGTKNLMPTEIQWFHNYIAIDYNIILDLRNESAVAALALHDWSRYEYNNKAYTQLLKEMSADNTLSDYCRTMQQSQTNKTIAMILLVLLFLLILPSFYLLYYRHRIYYRYCLERINNINEILLNKEELSRKLEQIASLGHEIFPEELQNVVSQIQVSLHKAYEIQQEEAYNIEIAEDNCRKAEYECHNLYVANSILDNCLSTLKHETMYYPSQIKVLMNDNPVNFEHVRELAIYYRNLHCMLYEQAISQLSKIKINTSRVKLNDITIAGNECIINYMIDLLKRISGNKELEIATEALDNQYIRLTVPMPTLNIAQNKVDQVFLPTSENFQLMLCKQIVRDHSELTNKHRCGIEAVVKDEKTYIIIILPGTKQKQ